MWWCAEQFYPGERFIKYAVLGDDVVIADERVAQEYAQAGVRGYDFVSEILDLS